MLLISKVWMINKWFGYIRILFYLLIYAFMNLSAFYMVVFASNQLNAETIDDWNGLGFKNPILSVFLLNFVLVT